MIMGGYSRQLRALHTAARDADRVPSAARAAVLRGVSPCSRLLACVWIASRLRLRFRHGVRFR